MRTSRLFAALVRELDSPHCSKAPTRTFAALMVALGELGAGSPQALRQAAGIGTWAEADRVLARMRRYGLATLAFGEVGRGGHRGKVYTVTDLGQALAAELAGDRVST